MKISEREQPMMPFFSVIAFLDFVFCMLNYWTKKLVCGRIC